MKWSRVRLKISNLFESDLQNSTPLTTEFFLHKIVPVDLGFEEEIKIRKKKI